MNNKGFLAIKSGVDLKCKMEFPAIFGGNLPGVSHEYRQDAVRPVDGFSALDHVHPHRRSTWWRPLREVARLYRAVPGDGLCTTDLSRESARYRSLSVGASGKALSHGLATGDQTIDAGRCQRDAGLAYPCRICAMPDRAGTQTLHRRQLRCRFGEHDLRAGLDDHRPVSVGFPGRCFAPPSRR